MSVKSLRGIALTAVVAAGALALAACTPPLPPDVLAAQAEANITCQSGAQSVGLPSEFTGAADAVNVNLSGVCPEQSLVEAAPGSGSSVEIVGAAPTAAELASFTKSCTTGAVTVPVFGYPVVMTLNVIGLEGVVLTPQAIAGILSGTVTSWTDPLIVDANAGVDFTGISDITVASVPGGAVTAMTTYLSKVADSGWSAGPLDKLSVGTSYVSYDELLADFTAADGAIAVVPANIAVNAGTPMASMRVNGTDISVDDTQLLKVGIGAITITSNDANGMIATPAIGGVPVEGNFDAAAAKIVLQEGQEMIGWPVIGIAHAMVCSTDPLALSTAQYLVRLAGQGSFETFGLVPLPEPIRIATFAPLKVTAGTAPPSSAAAPTDGAVASTPADASAMPSAS